MVTLDYKKSYRVFATNIPYHRVNVIDECIKLLQHTYILCICLDV